jgi:hypothetical protein
MIRPFAKSVLFLFLVVQTTTLLAQRSELGFGLGTFNYTGDLAQRYNFLNSKPAATVFYRANMSKVVSFRAALTGGKVGASDARSDDAFADRRNASFNVFLIEASGVIEYHFLNWRDDKHILRYSPYLFGGLALFGLSGNNDKPVQYSNVQGAVPFGVGIKYILNPKWYLALEFGARKTFFDYLDNVSVGDRKLKNYQYGNPFDNDAYYYLGLSVTRTFYEIPCPTNPYK